MSTQIRGASQINDTEFLDAYNDAALSNQEVLTKLNTDWTAIGVKLRSPRVTLHTTLERTGGKGGNGAARKEIALEAKIWVKNGSIQSQPKSGGYVSLAERVKAGTITIDAELNIVGTTAPVATLASVTPTASVAPTATTTEPSAVAPTATAQTQETTTAPIADIPQPVAVDPRAFKFSAEIFGSNYELAGPTKEDAMHSLFTKLQELNFSKVAITNLDNRQPCGINDIRNNGRYKFAKQLTAA